MEIEQVKNKLYKHDGEYSILYEELIKINYSFDTLLSLKEAKSKQDVKSTMLEVVKKSNKDVTEKEIEGLSQLIDSLVWVIFKDIRECHKTIYG